MCIVSGSGSTHQGLWRRDCGYAGQGEDEVALGVRVRTSGGGAHELVLQPSDAFSTTGGLLCSGCHPSLVFWGLSTSSSLQNPAAHPVEVGQQRRHAGVGDVVPVQALQEGVAHIPEHDLRRE